MCYIRLGGRDNTKYETCFKPDCQLICYDGVKFGEAGSYSACQSSGDQRRSKSFRTSVSAIIQSTSKSGKSLLRGP